MSKTPLLVNAFSSSPGTRNESRPIFTVRARSDQKLIFLCVDNAALNFQCAEFHSSHARRQFGGADVLGAHAAQMQFNNYCCRGGRPFQIYSHNNEWQERQRECDFLCLFSPQICKRFSSPVILEIDGFGGVQSG